ncbi:MAG: hypothetical protein N2449_08120 [Bacteroidales bacterium]|nr:hypothetical protein [Bacteroidales bacterium]
MKTKITIILAVMSLSVLNSIAQCERKNYCDDYMEDYDYRSQSSYAKLSPGDTASVNIVLYGNQKYRIFVCNDPKLGNVQWKVVQPERKTKRTIDKIKKDTIITYETNEYGDYKTDKNGELIIKSRQVVIDTTWITERISVDKILFDNKQQNKQPYFEITPQKSSRYIVRVQIPSGDPNYAGCVNVYVGRKELGGKNFVKKGSISKNE